MTFSKRQILNFLNKKFNLNITSIESLGNGIIYAHLLYLIDKHFKLDKVYRILNITRSLSTGIGDIAHLNVNLNVEYVNFEILKVCQEYLNGRTVFEVERLGSCFYFDNLEVVRYLIGEVILRSGECIDTPSSLFSASSVNRVSTQVNKRVSTQVNGDLLKRDFLKNTRKSLVNEEKIRKLSAEAPQKKPRISSIRTPRLSLNSLTALIESEKEVELNPISINKEHSLRTFMKELENERDFYYKKLLKIEKCIKKGNLSKIEKVLYEKKD